MSSCNHGLHADTVKIEFVKAKCHTEYDNFIIALDSADIGFNDFCHIIHSGDIDVFGDEGDKEDAVAAAWETLCKAFLLETGLELGCVHHSADEKSDELDGGVFSVGGVYELTPSGKKYESHITRLFWTTFG